MAGLKRLSAPAIVIDAELCTFVGPQLADAIRLHLARGSVPPRHLVDLADAVNALASEWSAGFSGYPQVSGPYRTAHAGTGSLAGGSGQPVRLTATEAARLARVSDSYMCRVLRRGTLGPGSQKIAGSWAVDSGELAAWLSERREEHEPKAA